MSQTTKAPVDASAPEQTLDVKPTVAHLQIFFNPRQSHSWFVDRATATYDLAEETSYCVPIVLDTEYYQNLRTPYQLSARKGLTVQVKSINKAVATRVYRHPDSSYLNNKYNYPLLTRSAPIQFISDTGYTVSLSRCDDFSVMKKLPTMNLALYGHFLTAELRLVFTNDLIESIDTYVYETGKNKPKFNCVRRLTADTPTKAYDLDYIQLPFVITVDGISFRLTLSLFDTIGVIGNASYKEFCEVSGVTLDAKDLLTQDDKENMDLTFVNKADYFHEYAIGDLMVYEALEGFASQTKVIYQRLNIPESLHKIPKLTSGATVKDLFTAAAQDKTGFYKVFTEVIEPRMLKIKEEMKALAVIAGVSMKQLKEDQSNPKFNELAKELSGLLTWEKFSEQCLAVASAGHYRLDANRTSALLSKVFGGRCRNNRPDFVSMVGAIADNDIGGAYAECQRVQDYPFGSPEVWDYKTAEVTAGVSLRKWMKEYETDAKKYANGNYGELVPGLWQANVETRKPLAIAQDFFSSWVVNGVKNTSLLAKYASKISEFDDSGDDDFGYENGEFDEEDGTVKIFKREIYNSCLTHDGLQWLLFICSPQQRDELLDNLYVVASVVYPKSERLEGLEQLLAKRDGWRKSSVNRRKRRLDNSRFLQTDDGECHAWFSIPLSKLTMDEILANRKCYPKKTPMNNVFKLFANTQYGDMTAKYFDIANTTVGNNITSRCRSLCWFMEKGLNGWQSITDGTAFDLNQVVYARHGQRVYADKLMQVAEASPRDRDRLLNVSLAPLGNYQSYQKDGDDLLITRSNGKVMRLSPKLWHRLVDNLSMVHLQKLFPSVDVLHGKGTSVSPVKKTGTNELESIAYTVRRGQFIFECKNVYDRIATHGAANYVLFSGDKAEVKMRSYRSKGHRKYVANVNGDIAVEATDYQPAKEFLVALAHTPTAVPRGQTFGGESIIKLGDARQQVKSLKEIGLSVGDSIIKPGLLREFSLSQFTFNTLTQYRQWLEDVTEDKEYLGQSLERYFLNDDGTLNYALMVSTVAKMIREDVMSYRDYFNRRKVSAEIKHPSFDTLTEVRKQAKQ